jgi:hypothetical protein
MVAQFREVIARRRQSECTTAMAHFKIAEKGRDLEGRGVDHQLRKGPLSAEQFYIYTWWYRQDSQGTPASYN